MRPLTLAFSLGSLIASSSLTSHGASRTDERASLTDDEPAPLTLDKRGGAGAASSPLAYAHAFGAFAIGRGLRLNNPYRLETTLGSDTDGLSLTATYLDLGLGATFGDAYGLQHGAVAHLSVAVSGIAQEVASLSYVVLLPLGQNFMTYGRAGVPVVLEPDLGAGLELGFGGVWMLTGGVGVTTELVSSLFFGAATWEHDPILLPVLSLQLGAWVEYEVLP